jgi:hypothetical protein
MDEVNTPASVFGLPIAARLSMQCDGVLDAWGGADITWLYPHSAVIGCVFLRCARARQMDIPRLLWRMTSQKPRAG